MCWRRCGGGDIWSPAQILDYLRLHLAPVEMASRKFVSASGAAIVYASIRGDLTPKHAAAPIDRKPRGTEIKVCVMPDLPFSLFPCLSAREPHRLMSLLLFRLSPSIQRGSEIWLNAAHTRRRRMSHVVTHSALSINRCHVLHILCDVRRRWTNWRGDKNRYDKHFVCALCLL